MPCFPENGRNNCSFVSVLSVVSVSGSLVILTFSFGSSFLIMLLNSQLLFVIGVDQSIYELIFLLHCTKNEVFH